MEVFIDGVRSDTNAETSLELSLSIASITDPTKSRTGYSKPFKLPMTPHNRQIMGDCSEITSTTMFNQTEHYVRVEQDGYTIMDGNLYLIACNENPNGSGEYSVAIIGPGKEWVRKAAATPLRQLGIDFRETISAAMIGQSWTWDKPVRFLPVERDSFAVKNHYSHLFPPVKILSFEDYHPFLHVRTMFETIFAAAGYSIESEFIASNMFGSLYISGNYPRKSIDGDKSKMDFLAGRFREATATANSTGKVYADPFINFNTIGNIVETADPREVQDGKTLENVFTKNGCFTKIGNRIAFVPTHSVVIGFEYKIHYTADYYMQSRDELRTFNRLYLSAGQVKDYTVVNSNTDRRNELQAGKTFMAVVFGHRDGDTYQFRYDKLANEQVDPENPQAGEITEIVYATFGSRTQEVTITGSQPVVNPAIWIKPAGGSSFVPYEKDWALYDGYVQERGEIEVEMTIRSSPGNITPSQPKYFDQIYFGGAEAGMKFTLGKNTTIKPLFASYPCEGSTVKFEDVAAHEVSCLDMINAVRHMFNLTFFTDNLEKTVRIEPRKDFYKKEPVVDWSHKIDLSMPVSIKETGDNLAQTYTMRYLTGDGTVSRWNRTNSERFGSHSWDILNKFAKEGETISHNPMFTASISRAGSFPNAPSARLVQAGDRETDVTDDLEELNFPAKIVRYLGMAKLPGEQKWGWPWSQRSYPFIAFHHNGNNPEGTGINTSANSGDPDIDMENGFSLCFEDRDSVEGLHRFYDKTFDTYNKSKKIEAYITLGPEEIEPFVFPNSLQHDFRALYRLVINGENALYRLEQICDYDPKAPSTKCVFIKEI